MGGSNSLKFVLPAIMFSSDILKEIYSAPVGFGKNLSDKYGGLQVKPFDSKIHEKVEDIPMAEYAITKYNIEEDLKKCKVPIFLMNVHTYKNHFVFYKYFNIIILYHIASLITVNNCNGL